jgi:hypothetical protein
LQQQKGPPLIGQIMVSMKRQDPGQTKFKNKMHKLDTSYFHRSLRITAGAQNPLTHNFISSFLDPSSRIQIKHSR